MAFPSRFGRRALIGVAIALPFFPLGCSKDSAWPDRPGPKVVVSFAPLYCFAVNVAGDDAVVKPMMSNTGPHNFQPTQDDARLVQHADLFFVIGLDLDEKQANDLQAGSGNKNLKVIELGEKIPDDKLLAGSGKHEHGDGEHKDHEHGIHDPHVWLGPDRVIMMVEGIRDELKTADPPHAVNYDRRAAEYISKLRKLKADGLEMLKGKNDRKLATFHESLGYFANEFQLDVVGYVQAKAGSEPNSDEQKKLVALCNSKKVRLIAIEPQYSATGSANNLKEELKRKGIQDVELVEIDPLETVRPEDLTSDWYEQKMRANIEALAKAMK